MITIKIKEEGNKEFKIVTFLNSDFPDMLTDRPLNIRTVVFPFEVHKDNWNEYLTFISSRIPIVEKEEPDHRTIIVDASNRPRNRVPLRLAKSWKSGNDGTRRVGRWETSTLKVQDGDELKVEKKKTKGPGGVHAFRLLQRQVPGQAQNTPLFILERHCLHFTTTQVKKTFLAPKKVINKMLYDSLKLVEGHLEKMPTKKQINKWNDEEKTLVAEWASATNLAASGSFVPVPLIPKVLQIIS